MNILQALGNFLDRASQTGGLLRVRAMLSASLTGGGIAYLLIFEQMPPNEYNILWGSSMAYYFGTRGNNNGNS